MEIARIVVAGTESGVGKTSLTLGLVMLLRRRGLRVQTFKVGLSRIAACFGSSILACW